jgi:NAD-dependent dihydropyrimidine dehydrogenase PreA subunit
MPRREERGQRRVAESRHHERRRSENPSRPLFQYHGVSGPWRISRKDEPAFATADMLYIHPDECIDCGACVPACPVEAIFALDETPNKWADFIEKNAGYYGDRG